MSYQDRLRLEQSDNCTVILQDGLTLVGDMRNIKSVAPHHELVWVLFCNTGSRHSWTKEGYFTLNGAPSKYDIAEFEIGDAPVRAIPIRVI